MKKYLLGIIAVVIAVGLSAFTTNTKTKTTVATTDWYPVDQSSQLTTSTTPVVYDMEKADAISAQSCNNLGSAYCLVGADAAPSVGTPASSFGSDFQIKRSN